ncbi:hypothetical protein B4090_3505 [Bacillus licheniformis]|uniref:hypothetical protein n=1 Tax=Bacillus licheniformis TaxID=1402 RepID=UPI0007793D8E|nr:hypothetical protein [Bacillus licheniformis]KYC76819.1 hypothetical protein B4090_3505 [Bacillus licheniformis]
MGVSRTDWIIIGADIGMMHYDDDRYEEYDEFDLQNTTGKITYLIDCMCGDYFFVGEVVKFAEDGFGIYEFSLDENYYASKERVRKFILDKFNVETEPKMFVISHYT